MMNVFMLQLIAMITMFCDHVASTFLDNLVWMRCVGRFAFPIYALLLAEGYRHMRSDRDRVWQHLGGYVILALVSEACYDVLEFKPITITDMAGSQSALITLLLAFVGLIAIDHWKGRRIYVGSVVLLTALMNYLIKSNYKFAGVLLVYALYFYLNKMEKLNYGQRLLFLLGIFACYLPIYHWARYDFSLTAFVEKLPGANTWWYLTHILIACLLAGYNGELGIRSKTFHLVYKWFYPAHLLLLGIIWQLM
jgi:hypothetical protein